MTTWTRRGDVRSELLAAAEEAMPVFEAHEVVDAVLSRLLDPDVMDELAAPRPWRWRGRGTPTTSATTSTRALTDPNHLSPDLGTRRVDLPGGAT